MLFGIERQVERHDVFARRRQQNRVAPSNHVQAVMRLGECRACRPPSRGGPCTCVQGIEVDQGLPAVGQHAVVGSQRSGDVGEDPVHLPRFFALEASQVVVE